MLDKIKAFPIIIVAPSGTGKTTICQTVLEKLPTLRYSVSATTRKPREGEIDGKDYYFLSPTVFKGWIGQSKFSEWAEVYGALYGTPKEPLNQYLIEGYNVLLAIDIQGARAIKLHYPVAVSIFILPPSIDELKNRLTKRNKNSPIEIKKRLETVKSEINHLKEFDYVVVNEELNTTIQKIVSIITAERCRTWRFSQVKEGYKHEKQN